jgi:hypothetical protein
MNSSSRPVLVAADEIRWMRLVPSVALVAWTASLALRQNPWSFLDWVNLAFHEAGHLFLLPFGETLHFLGGTILQLLIPMGLTVHFLRKNSPFSASACLWWFGQNFLGIAIYMADARELKLPLVGGGENDWNHLFYEWGPLGEESVLTLSSLTHGVGVVFMAVACLWMIFLSLPAGLQESLAGRIVQRHPWLQILSSQGE